jgi:hypothetical protein
VGHDPDVAGALEVMFARAGVSHWSVPSVALY